ncbi:MAG: 1-acyl-sn-glycerol-3-phosphate acyltransferase [Saprospiraceae bacterium]
MDYRLVRQSSGWLYLILVPMLHVAYRLLFRKMYLHNRPGVKANTPVIIAANHPTAFIDPIFFTNFFDPPVYNMTRGDIFRKPFFRRLLESCNMFPVFRQRDGYAGRDRNDEVFEFCQKKLLARVAVNIFVEGEHHLDKRVLGFQKGFARIAFGTYERHRLHDLQIVPVGCNYVYGDRDRDEAKIIVGAPIFIKDYWPLYEESPGRAIAQLCRDLEKELKSICYHIEDRADDALAEQLLQLWRNDHPAAYLPIVEHRAPRFFGEKALLDRLNAMPELEKNTLREHTSAYFAALEKTGLNDEALARPEQGNAVWLFFLALAAPLAGLGFLVGWPVRALARRVADKAAKKREFYTSVLMGVTTLAGGVYLAGMLLSGLLLGKPWLVTLALMAPLLTWLSLFWKETLLRWAAAQKAKSHPQRAQLLTLRKEARN